MPPCDLLPLHPSLKNKLHQFINKQQIPHIVFYGPAGSGKKTLVAQFLMDIYGGDVAIKENVMFVNCAQGKGIRFIRDELKSFAKMNIHIKTDPPFKTIVLLNADFLTTEGQSALRRCIESFSQNTRFFIIVENKNKLLNPILSRFCELYVPEFNLEGFTSLYQYNIHRTLPADPEMWRKQNILHQLLTLPPPSLQLQQWVALACLLPNRGLSAFDYITYIENHEENDFVKTNTVMYYYIVCVEHRHEPLLLFTLFEYYHRCKSAFLQISANR
jgi:hypothetical protein